MEEGAAKPACCESNMIHASQNYFVFVFTTRNDGYLLFNLFFFFFSFINVNQSFDESCWERDKRITGNGNDIFYFHRREILHQFTPLN